MFSTAGFGSAVFFYRRICKICILYALSDFEILQCHELFDSSDVASAFKLRVYESIQHILNAVT